jgi:hypothetical protein
MKQIFILIILVLHNPLVSQDNPTALKVLVSSRVDTGDKKVRAILELYENYFNSNPESIYDNPYWNKAEKNRYRDFDFSRESIFQNGIDAEKLFRYYRPLVMSVEPIGEKYQIRVLYSSPSVDPNYAGSKVWCIQKLNAVQEGDSWVLENLIVEITRKWHTREVGMINYLFSPNHEFDYQEAMRAKEFCDDIIKRFNPDYSKPIKYYLTNSIDEMGLLENFDYYFVGMTTGKSRNGMIFSAKGNEFYPHEFVHHLLITNKKRGYVIEEGLATFLGTRQNMDEYMSLMNKLAMDLMENPDRMDFKSTVSQEIKFNGYQTAYPAGAGICELVYYQSGDKGLNLLASADTESYGAIVAAVSSITKLSEKEIENEWLQVVMKYENP